MQEEFDKIFGQKVKEVFENRQEPYNAEDWEKLLAKKSERKKRLFFWRLNKSAAIIILLLMLGGTGGVFLYKSFQNPGTEIQLDQNEIIGKTDSEEESKKNSAQPGTLDSINNKKEDSFKQKTENNFLQEQEVITKIESSKSPDDISSESPKKIKERNTNPLEQIKQDNLQENEAIVFNEQQDANKLKLIDPTKESQIERDSTELISTKSELGRLADNSNPVDTTLIKQNISINEAPDKMAILEDLKSIDSLTNDAEKLALDKTKDIEPTAKVITIGLVVAPMVNYDQANQNTDVNVGGGVLVEIPISKRFDIYTGLLVANQRINFEENTLQELSSGTQLKSKNAVLTGLDIPLNLKYNFKMNKNNMFIAVGLSSLTYFKENVESTYQVSSTVFAEGSNALGNDVLVSTTTNVLETETESKGSFNNFHFGKIINFSYGLEIPLKNNRQSIIVEPYYKYSLEPANSENLIFSSAGLNLKLNFNPKNKSK